MRVFCEGAAEKAAHGDAEVKVVAVGDECFEVSAEFSREPRRYDGVGVHRRLGGTWVQIYPSKKDNRRWK
jgi:hypothetical protein